MMDSQENKEMNKTLNTTEDNTVTTSDTKDEKTVFETKQDVLDKLKQLFNNAKETNKSELDTLKSVYYKIQNQEVEKQKHEFLQKGGDADEFKPTPDLLEQEFKTLFDKVKEERRRVLAELDKLKKENLKKKEEILSQIKSFIESPQEANNSYKEFKELQSKWNEIKLIPQSKASELWRNYQLYVEQFYDMLKLNNEFREYDFKKNLERKTELCELAEELDKEKDVISAFHQLQKFHQQWREVGPVARELRDEIWERFKEASTVINKKHQDHFDKLKEQEEQNLKDKTEICEIIEQVDYSSLIDYNTWNNKTEEILKLQDKWKTIGFTPRKMNTKIFERFRTACDVFFDTKSEFFKELNDEKSKNLEKKLQLCKEAESLKDSTDWRDTSNKLIQLQKEWKKIGPVFRSQSNAVWKRFNSACDFFFENRNKQNAEQRKAEQENLNAKKEVINKIKELIIDASKANEVNEEIHELIKKWNSIGFVPFKVKDSIYKEYRTLIDTHFKRVNKGQTKEKLQNFKNIVDSIQEGGNENTLYRERERLLRTADRIKSDLTTYENNLGFLTLSSKKGSSLLNEVNKKIEKFKNDITVLNKKIELIDQKLDNN